MEIKIKSQVSGEEKFIFIVENESVKYLKNGVVRNGAFEMEQADISNIYIKEISAYMESIRTGNPIPMPVDGYIPPKYYYDKTLSMVTDSKGVRLWTNDIIENYVVLEPGYQPHIDKHVLIIHDKISNTEKVSEIWLEVK